VRIPICRRLLPVLFTFLCTPPSICCAEQGIVPSVYLGYGTGTNIGGELGIGAAVRIDEYFSASAAVGTWNDSWPAHTGAQSRFDYSVGLQYYPFRRVLFAGLSYGIVSEALYTSGVDGGQVRYHFEKIHGVSFSIGARVRLFRPVHGGAFLGITGNHSVNTFSLFGGEEQFFPQFGVMLGCDLGTIQVDTR
jgi:hypothetical protein